MPDKLTITDTLPISWLSAHSYRKAYKLLSTHKSSSPMYYALSSTQFVVITTNGIEKHKYLKNTQIRQYRFYIMCIEPYLKRINHK